MAAHSIAVPLSPGFPAHELKYILEHSEALMLLSSNKFHAKAQETLDSGRDTKSVLIEKKLDNGEYTKVTLSDPPSDKGGMMLYTSGTTNRPVSAVLALSNGFC
jgi:long-subunit acyl-CoA synthetase (AMP-forming)